MVRSGSVQFSATTPSYVGPLHAEYHTLPHTATHATVATQRATVKVYTDANNFLCGRWSLVGMSMR